MGREGDRAHIGHEHERKSLEHRDPSTKGPLDTDKSELGQPLQSKPAALDKEEPEEPKGQGPDLIPGPQKLTPEESPALLRGLSKLRSRSKG